MGFLLRIAITLGLLAMVLALPVVCDADPFSLSGNWNYRENGGDDVETTNSFNQSYNLNFVKQLSAAMNLSASTRYNENQLSSGSDSSSLNPSASFDLRNDLFSLMLNGSESRFNMEDSADVVNKTWGANFYSQLEKWPSLRLSYNQSSSQDDQSVHDLDTESSNLGASIEYSLSSFDMLYDFNYGTSDDLVNDTYSDTMNHYAQLKYSESFFRSRLTVAATQQYSSNETETDNPVSPVTLLAGFSRTDNTPLDGALASNSALVDGNTQISAGVEISRSANVQNVGVQVNHQSVSRLLLFFDEEIRSSDQARLPLASWELYKSADNQSWTKVILTLDISFAMVAGKTRATIDFLNSANTSASVVDNYIKIVIKPIADLVQPVSVTEVDAGVLRMSADSRDVTKTKFVSHQSQFSVSYRPAPAWATGYSMRRVLNLPESGPDNTQITHSVNASYSPNRYLSMAVAATENTDNTDGLDEARSRSYSLAFNSSPLPTLDLSLGYTRTHSYEGGDETSQSDQVNGNVTAEIYPDLTVGLSPSWTRNRSLDTGAKTTNYGFTLTSSVRLNPRMNLTANLNYFNSTTDSANAEDQAGSTKSRQYGATLSYRPSDVLLVSSSLQRDEESDNTSLSGNLAWLFTRSIQANAGASYSLSDSNSEQYNASVHWSISRNLSLQGTGGYQVADSGNSWNLGTSLNANY